MWSGGREPSVSRISGTSVGAGAAARRGCSLGRGQHWGMQPDSTPPRREEQVPGHPGRRMCLSLQPPANPTVAVLGPPGA
jgi:hypothetical protein